MSSLLIFLAVLSVLVVVHEFGHFVLAKWVGIRVEKFSIGFGPVIFGRNVAGTDFVVSLLPLGGFVKMAGEHPADSEGKPWEFNSKTLGQKFLVVFAGPLMNALLAFLLFSVTFMIGQPTLTTKIGKVLNDTPAQTAGIHEGDRIVAVDGQRVTYWVDVLNHVQRGDGKISFVIDRGGRLLEIPVQPKAQEVRGLFGGSKRRSFIGVMPSSEIITIRSGFFRAFYLGAKAVVEMTATILYSLGLMITGVLPFKDSVTGPIGIYIMTQKYAQMGLVYLFYFTGSLSVSLFVLNLLPIPVLDGGHVLFILIERLKGSPLRESVRERMTQGGLVLLLALMAFVVLQDVHRFSIVENVVGLFKKGP